MFNKMRRAELRSETLITRTSSLQLSLQEFSILSQENGDDDLHRSLIHPRS